MVKNAPQLITYVDRLAGDLEGLRRLLAGPLEGVFGGVHLLPFFHPIDGADAGFDPIDHTLVDPRLGTWSDVARLAGDYDVMADVIVNHMSAQSPQFLEWDANGDDAASAGMFLTYDRVFGGGATEAELLTIYRPRPGLPFTLRAVNGRNRLLWTTFTSNQIDIDVEHPAAWEYLTGILDTLAEANVRMVRLDAVGYAIKRAGSSCFMIPETFEFVDRLSAECRARDMTMLVEIHGYWGAQIDIAERVDLVYDFALPPLVLDAIFTGDAEPLKEWIRLRPQNCITVLDTHDGIGVIDVGPDVTDRRRPALLPPERIDALVRRIHVESGGSSQMATGASASNLDLYQVNCTFFDALGGDDARYRMARVIQLLLPGIPQIYYVGMLNGSNDVELLERTGVGRDINRHYYGESELEAALARPAVRELLDFYRWRGAGAGRDDFLFDGSFSLMESKSSVLHLRWSTGTFSFEARLDLAAMTMVIDIDDGTGVTQYHDLGFARRS